MERVSSDVVVLPSGGIYRPSVGLYGVRRMNRITWHHCREQFHNDMQWMLWLAGFYFSHPKPKRELIAEFIDEIESMLELQDRTEFYRTNIPTIMYVKPAPFWFSQSMRFSLFTILMRAGLGHEHGQSIEDTMRANIYLSQTFRAVKMFLAGRNRYTGFGFTCGWGGGWHSAFSRIPCCGRAKCKHTDRRCRRAIDASLVPWWQFFPINVVAQAYRAARRLTKSCYGLLVQSDVQSGEK